MDKIAALSRLLFALGVNLRRRFQLLFVALSCAVLVSCGGPSEEELAERAAKRAEQEERVENKLAELRTLIRNEEYCEAQIEASGWLAGILGQNNTSYALAGEVMGILSVAKKGCLPDDDESKTWACAEGHSCR